MAKHIPQLAMPAVILASLVAVSRVYLGVHYPSDCLVGFLITRFTILLLLGF